MNWLQGFFYGLISGFTEFMPVSSQAHQKLMLQIFGQSNSDPVCNLIVHLCAVVALFFGLRGYIARLRREQHLAAHRRRDHRSGDVRTGYDLRLIRTAIVPAMLMMLLLVLTRNWTENHLLIAIFSIINGVILFLAERFPHGNKDSRHMSVLDALVLGLIGSLSVFPGISRVGASVSYATMRGADKQQSVNWVLLLSIPVVLMLCIFDIVGIATGNVVAANFSVIAGYFTAGAGSLIGTYLCVMFARNILSRTSMAVFAYYSWGIALLSFALYLIS